MGAVGVLLCVSTLGGSFSCCPSPGHLRPLLLVVAVMFPVSGGGPRSDGLSPHWGQAPALAPLHNSPCAWPQASLIGLVPSVVASCPRGHVRGVGLVASYLVDLASSVYGVGMRHSWCRDGNRIGPLGFHHGSMARSSCRCVSNAFIWLLMACVAVLCLLCSNLLALAVRTM